MAVGVKRRIPETISWQETEARERVKLACKPGSVGRPAAPGSHSSGPAVACRLERPTREQREPRCRSPIWSCSGWGLACRPCCHVRGGLLPDSLATARAPCGAHTVSPSPDPTSFSLQERDFATLRPQSRASAIGSLFSVPLSIASRRPAVNRHPALRSPDFPLRKRIAQRLPGQLQIELSHRKAGVPEL